MANIAPYFSWLISSEVPPVFAETSRSMARQVHIFLEKALMLKTLLILLLIPGFAWAQTYDVRTYGAKVDGITDDLTALKAAVSAAVASRGTVTIPNGSIYVDFRGQSPIALSRGVKIAGLGRGSIIRTNRAVPTAFQVLFLVPAGDSASLSDLSIIGPDSSGTVTTRAVGHAGGFGGVIRLDNVYIEGFSDGIKSDEGTTQIIVTNCEIAKCGMGILFTGKSQGKVIVSGTTIRDTRPQTQLMGPKFYHGMYIYRQHEIQVTGCEFLRITGYGVHLWDGDTSSNTSAGSHTVSDCKFDTMITGILSGSKRGSTDRITNCRFIACDRGIKIQEGNADISSCEFRHNGSDDCAGIVPQNAFPGDVSISNSVFQLPSGTISAPGVLLLGETAAKWRVYGCTFYGSGGQRGSGINSQSRAGDIAIKNCQFYGTYSSAFSQGAILNEGGTISVDSSIFNIVGAAINIVPRNNRLVGNNLVGNRVVSASYFVKIWPASPGSVITTSGDGNLIEAGGEFFDSPDPAYMRNYQLGNRVGSGGILQADGTVTLSRNYDTWHIRRITTISRILMAGIYHASEFGRCSINLIADSSFSIGSGGNIVPNTTAPRSIEEVVHLEYDTATEKWQEYQNKTGELPTLPNPVQLVYPPDSARMSADSIVFSWNRCFPQVERSWFEISTDSLFQYPIVDSSLVDTSKTLSGFANDRTYWWRVRGGNEAGWGPFQSPRHFVVLRTGMQIAGQVPTSYELKQNFPNPFNPSTTIRYGLPQRAQVTLTVFNTLGQKVAQLVNGDLDAGYHEVKFDGAGLSSGVYFYRLRVGDFVETRKLLLVR